MTKGSGKHMGGMSFDVFIFSGFLRWSIKPIELIAVEDCESFSLQSGRAGETRWEECLQLFLFSFSACGGG
jgi:hypothetical protein